MSRLRFFGLSILAYSMLASQFLNSDCGTDNNDCSTEQCGTSENSCGGKSFFRPRSIVEDMTTNNAINQFYFHRQYLERDALNKDQNIHFARGLFYQNSTSSKDKNLAKYFTPNNKNTLSVREDGSGDLGSLWFKVISPVGTSYESEICLNPERTAFGSFINFWHYFECVDKLWLNTRFGVYEAHHNLHAREKRPNINIAGTLPGARTVLDYTSGEDLKYGKISKCDIENSGMDDIVINLGYDILANDDTGYYLGLYAGGIFPIAPPATAEFLFEPLIGRGHWGASVGLNGGAVIFENDCHTLAFLADFNYQYLFKKTELRSFDLKNNGPWSRYLRVAKESAPGISLPAINFTTLEAKVEPKGSVNFWGALHYHVQKWHVEAGYNLWWKQGDKVCLDKESCFANNKNFDSQRIGIFGMGNVCTPTSASTANISQGKNATETGNVVVNDAEFTPLTLSDIDLCSAAQPSALTNKVYVIGGYDACFFSRPLILGLGAAYEFASNHNALSQWTLWFDMQTSF